LTPSILHRDAWLLAVCKPSGLVVHRGFSADRVTLVGAVRRIAGAKGASPVHRLDRGASGVVLFALDSAAARSLAALFERRAVGKSYLALVRGIPPDESLVSHPLPRSAGGPRVEAETMVRRLATAELEPRALSLVEARPREGRLHQVRRHLKHLGHPIIGDANWGRGDLNRAIKERYGLERLALHCASLALVHPFTGEPLEIRAPLPDDLAGPLAAMGLAAAHNALGFEGRIV
jgi:tRNA pseudouridine65 synthase